MKEARQEVWSSKKGRLQRERIHGIGRQRTKGIGTAAALGAKDAKALAAEVCPISPP